MQPHNILRGILFMCAASAIFPIMNAMVKHLSAELPTAEIVWARNLSHLIFVTLLFAPKRGWRLAATQRLGGQILRSCLLLGSNIFYFTAMATVPLAEASAISFISPFLVALIAAFVLPALDAVVAICFGLITILEGVALARPGGAGIRRTPSAAETDLIAAVMSQAPPDVVGHRRVVVRSTGGAEYLSFDVLLKERITLAREQAIRALLEQMLLDPAKHRRLRISQRELGVGGCGVWSVMPKLGPMGRLMGWWRVKLSSGCPLAT